jgi:hypothetical protein
MILSYPKNHAVTEFKLHAPPYSLRIRNLLRNEIGRDEFNKWLGLFWRGRVGVWIPAFFPVVEPAGGDGVLFAIIGEGQWTGFKIVDQGLPLGSASACA